MKKASIFKTRKPLRQLALRAAVNGHWREKAPMPFSCFFSGAPEACSNPPKTGLKSLSGAGILPSPEGGHTAAHTGKQGALLRRGLGDDDTASRRKRMCAFTACVHFLRCRGPAGLRNLFFGYSVVIFVLSSVYPKRGNIRVAAGGHNVLSNSPESDSKSFSGVGMLPSPKESHTAAHRGKHGAFCAEVL